MDFVQAREGGAMAQEPELTVIQKMFDLTKWMCQHTARFPRCYKFVLGDRIERRVGLLLELLLRAKYTRIRRELLHQANLELELLRFDVRLAHELKCLRPNSFEHAVKALLEVGRMIGGWLKQTSQEAAGGRG